ncbi:replication fork protection component Swi3-domain-containing protein [Cokeromyces recurvatus]|uniref:replication fork protection component Swi3-domain-containing protein n=1 Tax=Cokeromyces recurvatus TaxID=90255 RepID=UPI00221EA8B6|nr:replication fork protection component Swi3-domain-containing protein [Cokeromyces recurvatus]KAI7901300.1 replication fork protection component Swi3-domain-containing protein [Cokeromyces recurvatus]
MDDFDDILLDDYNINDDSNEPNSVQKSETLENQPDELPSKSNKKLRLDESLLLDTKGIPLLKNESMHLKFKGKGYESEDLKKLMTYYTIWANNLYPKLRFRDFTRRVTKQASKPRIKVMIKEWQQEYKERRQVRLDIERELNENAEKSNEFDNEEHKSNENYESHDDGDDNQPLFYSLPTNSNSTA